MVPVVLMATMTGLNFNGVCVTSNNLCYYNNVCSQTGDAMAAFFLLWTLPCVALFLVSLMFTFRTHAFLREADT